jgi:hypothetical protein
MAWIEHEVRPRRDGNIQRAKTKEQKRYGVEYPSTFFLVTPPPLDEPPPRQAPPQHANNTVEPRIENKTNPKKKQRTEEVQKTKSNTEHE